MRKLPIAPSGGKRGGSRIGIEIATKCGGKREARWMANRRRERERRKGEYVEKVKEEGLPG